MERLLAARLLGWSDVKIFQRNIIRATSDCSIAWLVRCQDRFSGFNDSSSKGEIANVEHDLVMKHVDLCVRMSFNHFGDVVLCPTPGLILIGLDSPRAAQN